MMLPILKRKVRVQDGDANLLVRPDCYLEEEVTVSPTIVA